MISPVSLWIKLLIPKEKGEAISKSGGTNLTQMTCKLYALGLPISHPLNIKFNCISPYTSLTTPTFIYKRKYKPVHPLGRNFRGLIGINDDAWGGTAFHAGCCRRARTQLCFKLLIDEPFHFILCPNWATKSNFNPRARIRPNGKVSDRTRLKITR